MAHFIVSLTNEFVQIDPWHRVFCEWKEEINKAQDPIYFQCPADAFIAGVRSVFDHDSIDRM